MKEITDYWIIGSMIGIPPWAMIFQTIVNKHAEYLKTQIFLLVFQLSGLGFLIYCLLNRI
jgi:hypothetical protein